jgi:hypothetical protein
MGCPAGKRGMDCCADILAQELGSSWASMIGKIHRSWVKMTEDDWIDQGEWIELTSL